MKQPNEKLVEIVGYGIIFMILITLGILWWKLIEWIV